MSAHHFLIFLASHSFISGALDRLFNGKK